MAAPFRRPAMLSREMADQIPGDIDPAEKTLIAHETAGVIIAEVRATKDPAVVARLQNLAAIEGLDTLAEIWASAGRHTLPGALWQIYRLREWMHQRAESLARIYQAGRSAAPVRDAIAGIADPPDPQQISELADQIFKGIFVGDFATALDRASAFCRIVATGLALEASVDEGHADSRAHVTTVQGSAINIIGDDLERCAQLWRQGKLF